jgi:predicted transposase YbfD/YdcC
MIAIPLAGELPAAPSPPCTAEALAAPGASLPPLVHFLAQVPDGRGARGKRHPLAAVLALVCCALLCGERYLQAIAEWGRNHPGELVAALGFTRPKTPCCATLHTVLSELDWTALEAQLRTWVQAVEACLATTEPAPQEEALAFDGKTLRGALKMGAEVTQMVTALGHRLGLTAGAREVKDGDEIAAVEALLREVLVAGRVVTADALHTQRQTAQLIGERGGHYVLTVKGNQPHLHEKVVQVFASERAKEQDRESATEIGRAHGRQESRWLLAVSVTPGELDWPGAAQAYVVVRRRWHRKRQEMQQEVVYGITSLGREQAGAEDLLRLVRGHWKVENRSHWVRDVTFGEDASLVRTGKLPTVLALLRTCVISRLRLDQVQNVAKETRRLKAQPADCLRLLGLAEN